MPGKGSSRSRLRAACRTLFAAALVLPGTGGIGPASAYIGDSFLRLPDAPGTWRGKEYKGWIRAQASEWQGRLQGPMSGPGDFLTGDKFWFGGPIAPKPGVAGKIIVSLNKRSTDLPRLMQLCASKAELPEMGYAENAVRARPVLENGPRPAHLPAWWEYRFKRVQVVDCPVLEGAEQQALVITFKDIEWLNYDPAAPLGNRITIPAEAIFRVQPAEPKPGKTIKSFVITWIAPATDPGDAACPRLNAKPGEADVYRYLLPEEAGRVRARFGTKGITYGGDSENRGPRRMSVSAFPGIIPDPGLAEPQTRIADGLDLDGNDGSGRPQRGVRAHENFTAPDGRRGIDNQLMRVWGCVTGMRGRRGYSNQTPNARRADGNIVTIVEISDIDDERNDNEVYVALIHSQDKAVRDIGGRQFIPGYSYRPTYDPGYAYFNVRLRGRIRDGVITTEVLPAWNYNPGQGPDTFLYQARMRFEPRADGSVKGLIGGYADYRNRGYGGYGEGLFNFQAPAIYYAMRRHADGLYDPASGEYNGLSMAYEIDTVPAFIVPLSPGELASLRESAATRLRR